MTQKKQVYADFFFTALLSIFEANPFKTEIMADFLHKELSQQIIGAFYDVYNTLGYGFLEKVYENVFFA